MAVSEKPGNPLLKAVGMVLFLGFFLWFSKTHSTNENYFDNSNSSYKNESSRVSMEIGNIANQTYNLKNQMDKDALDARISPYYKKISIMKHSAWNESNPTQEYVTIEADESLDAPINVSNWTIKSAVSGKIFKLGKATPLPEFGSVNPEYDVVLPPGGVIYLSSGRSPIGSSFQENKCTGYLDQYQDYYPGLAHECPTLYDAKPDVPLYRMNACYDYVRSVPECYMPVQNIPVNIGPECTKFITESTGYDYCVRTNKNYADFYKSRWRLFLKQPETIWLPKREVIELLDNNGKLVAEDKY